MEIGETLDVSTRREWREWLRRHHRSAAEIWLVYHKKASGKPMIPYNDAVEEAICFGWIDSIVKKLSEHSRVQRFTPRRSGSPLSPMNKERARRMIAQKRMTKAGLDSIGEGVLDEPFVMPPDILAAIKAYKDAWRHFQSMPESYKRIRIGFIDGSRSRPDAFETRLRYFLKMTAQGKRFGMVQ